MATTGRIVYHGDDETIKKEKREFSLTDEIMELINSGGGGGGGAINGVKVNGQVVNPDQAGYVGLTIPGVINNLSSNSTSDALSAKQGKVLYEYIQALQHVGHFLALWNTATGLPVTNPETSPYTYNTGDYYIVSNVAAAGGTNYKPNGSSYTINVASTTVESGEVQVNDIYFYDGYERRLLDNSGGGSSIAVDSSLSTTSTNPVQNAVITNRLNQMALDANTKTFWLTNLQDTTTGQAIRDWVDGGGNAIVYYSGMPYYMTAKSATRITLYSKFTGTQNSPSNQSTGFTEQLMWIDNNGTTITISNMTVGMGAPYLATNQNYATAYTPLYDGSPATKKYVDDKFSAVPVYTAGSNIDITSNQISTIRNGYVYVTCNDAASVKAKTGTSAEGNYTPTEGDLVMIHFTQGCAVGGPTIAIDGGTAIPFYIGVDGANAGNMYFGSINVSKMFIYTNGRLVGDAVKDNNTVYSAGTGLALSNGVFSNTQPGPTVSATAPASPSEGDMWYDTTNDALKVYNGSSWDEAGGGETYTAGDGITIDGNNEISAIPYVGGTDIEVVLGEAKKLPAGYTEVEWIQSDGACYVDTGIVSEGTDATETKFQVLGVPSSSGAVRPFFGSMEGNSLIRFSAGTYISVGSSSAASFFGGWNNTTQLNRADTNVHILQMVGGGSVMLDGVSTSYSHSDRNHPTITSYLFARHGDGDNVQTIYDGNGTKIYYHKQYRGVTQILDLIPCVRDSDDEPGFYDLVNERFLANGGSGTLTAGPEVTYNPVNVINFTGEGSNTKTFYLSSTSDLTNAQAAYDWYLAGKNPIIRISGLDYSFILEGDNVEPTCHLGFYGVNGGIGNGLSNSYISINPRLDLRYSSDTVTSVVVTTYNAHALLTDVDYSTPYTPQYNGSPATKKYVDDTVGGAISKGTTAPSNPVEGQLWYDTTNDVLKVYDGTAWVAVGGGGGGVNITDVTVATAYNTAAKVGTTTAGNYTPTAGDLLMVNFVNGCSVASPTLNIDGSGAKSIRTGNASATTSTLALGSTSNSNIKMLMYYDGTYYRTWSTSNNTYSGMSQSTASTGTSTTSSLISAKVLNDTIVEKAITLDPNSPLTVTTIWAGTETQYQNLSSKGATTAYLCVED